MLPMLRSIFTVRLRKVIFSIGLSDIDVAIVSDRFKDREKKLETFGKLTKEFFDSPFEFHVLTRKQWETHKKFIKNAKKV